MAKGLCRTNSPQGIDQLNRAGTEREGRARGSELHMALLYHIEE
ncbi:MAG: hypothetical protein OJF51_001106 [Nitrospira sp.]|nr:MAG: hypothetical protein OJF51_001106 [Nitrospira sp.]